MNTIVFALMMQVASTSFIVSTKAGVVNYVEGASTVKAATVVKPGKLVGTGPNGKVEILLNPGSYLRLGANTQVLLEKAELYDIAVRVVQGSALIEANGFTKDLPMTVSTGDLKMQIIKDGIYLFEDGKAIVVKGKIRDARNGLTYGDKYQVSDDQGYRAQKVQTFSTSLELWSEQRDAQIQTANVNVARSLSYTAGVPYGSFQDVWLWSPYLGSFIYMPGSYYRSPYGYVYQRVGPYYGGGGGYYGGGNANNGNTAANTPSTASNSGAGSSGGYSGLRPTGATAGANTSFGGGASVGGGRTGGGPARSTGK